jgi:hypothetical protein
MATNVDPNDDDKDDCDDENEKARSSLLPNDDSVSTAASSSSQQSLSSSSTTRMLHRMTTTTTTMVTPRAMVRTTEIQQQQQQQQQPPSPPTDHDLWPTSVPRLAVATPGSVASSPSELLLSRPHYNKDSNNTTTACRHPKDDKQEEEDDDDETDLTYTTTIVTNVYSSLVLVSLVTLVYISISATALVAWLVLISSATLLVRQAWQRRRMAWHGALRHRGMLGMVVVPTALVDLLNQSLHEFMSDPRFGWEWRHMILYFLPLSSEQLEAAVQQLAPHHRERLQRGLGDLVLGTQVMRILLGDEGIRQRKQLVEAAATQPQRQQLQAFLSDDYDDDDDDDDSMDLGLNVQGQDLAGGLDDNQALRLASTLGLFVQRNATARRSIPTTTTTTTTIVSLPPLLSPPLLVSPELQAAYDEEARVLSDLVVASANATVWQPFRDYVMDVLVNQVTMPLTQRTVRYGLGASLVSSGLGLLGAAWGSWSGSTAAMALPALVSWTVLGRRVIWVPRVPSRQQDPTAHAIWTMALWSGATAAVAWGVRSWLVVPQRRSNPNESSPSKKDRK